MTCAFSERRQRHRRPCTYLVRIVIDVRARAFSESSLTSCTCLFLSPGVYACGIGSPPVFSFFVSPHSWGAGVRSARGERFPPNLPPHEWGWTEKEKTIGDPIHRRKRLGLGKETLADIFPISRRTNNGVGNPSFLRAVDDVRLLRTQATPTTCFSSIIPLLEAASLDLRHLRFSPTGPTIGRWHGVFPGRQCSETPSRLHPAATSRRHNLLATST
jgi:hypothetical protein